MTLDRYTRWQAAPIHLGISALIAVLVIFAMLFFWYPQPYFRASGGQGLMLLLIGVDVVIGPLLTLIVFDPRKKYLKLDLAVIAALQFTALAYGTSVMFDARPVYVSFAGDRFELVEAGAIEAAQLAEANAEFRTLSITGPRVVGTRLPTDPGERVDWQWPPRWARTWSLSAVLRAIRHRVARGDRAVEAARATAGVAP